MDVLDGSGKQISQFLPLVGQTGGLRAEGAADQLHLTQNHILVLDKVAVHGDAVGVPVQIHPIGRVVDEPVPLLQEENIRGHVRARGPLEGVVGQTDGPQQLSPLCDVFPHGRVFFVHGEARGDEGNKAAGPHLVQGLGKEVVVDHEVVPVIALVRDLELPEGDVANGSVEEGIGQLRVLEALDGDGGLLIELLGDAA